MGPQVAVQQGGMTFGQFVWVWIGGMSAFGVMFIVGAWIYSKGKNVGHGQVRQILMVLIRSGMVREEEIVQALNAPHLPPAPDEMSGPMWLERILAGSPGIEQLIRLWRRPLWVDAPLYAGIGLFVACGICAIFFLAFPVLPNALSASYGVSLAAIMSLPFMGMLIGWGIGLFKGTFKVAVPQQPFTDRAQWAHPMEKYHSRWLLWGGIVLFLVPLILTLSALPFLSNDLFEQSVISLVVLPLLTLGALLLHEYFICRLAYLPPVQVGADSALEERFDTLFFFPRLLAALRWLEYGMLATMATGQAFLILSALNQREDEVYGPIWLGLLAFYAGFAALLGLRGSELR